MMKSSISFCFMSLLLCFFSIAAINVGYSSAEEPNECVYTLYVQTGNLPDSGTESDITVRLENTQGESVTIPILKNRGIMLPKPHAYFQRGNLDIFSATVPCIQTPLCRIWVSSDGKGPYPSWYLEYVEVTTTGPQVPCSKTTFEVSQWLATEKSPHQLTASVDKCAQIYASDDKIKRGASVVPSDRDSGRSAYNIVA